MNGSPEDPIEHAPVEPPPSQQASTEGLPAAPAAPIVDDHERGCWVAFNRTPGIGAARVRRLLERFGALAEAWRATPTQLAQAGLDRRTVEAVLTLRPRLDPERELERARRGGVAVLTWRDDDYPRQLGAIPDPPPVLYLRGALLPGDERALAVVGTRRPTYYGREVAERLSATLAGAGLTIISGLAKGVDTHAHRGALAAGGRTIAVLGHGLQTVYPPENRRLADAVAERGAVLTEYAPGVAPAAENFPPRNRIISGLSAGVLIVEAGEQSGALITSRYAAEQGRDVFAVPGPINSSASRGCHRLIQDGAKLVTDADDILEELEPHAERVTPRQMALDLAADAAPPTPDESRLVQLLIEAGQPTHVDQIARRLALPVQEISGTLSFLEVQGRVRHVGGMRYTLVR
ncbi:MAG: DNA-processing protein DprA [Chloroflexota bacterium]|nr:DNA-processing protein DprA [Chloroflexota bacterium]